MKTAERYQSRAATSSRQAALSVSIIALLFAAGPTISSAITVYFGDADRGPAYPMEIGGVTVSRSTLFPGASQPATRSGSGLGSATVGPVDSVDRREHYPAGSLTPTSRLEEGLHLAVDGVFNSITILPHFAVLGSNEPVFLRFDISIEVQAEGRPRERIYWTPYDPTPIAINFLGPNLPNGLDMALISDQGDSYYFQDYLSTNGLPDVTFEFGYVIKSLVYTPVPEPGTAVLFGIGVFGVWCAGRNRVSRRSA